MVAVMPGLVPGIHVSRAVIPGWSAGPDPESRDSTMCNCTLGFDASHRPGMTMEQRQECPESGWSRRWKNAAPSAPKPLGKHLFQNLPLDVLVGQRGIVPPPAVALHLLGGRRITKKKKKHNCIQ